MILRATGECIGDCGLVPQQVDGVAEIEIGYHRFVSLIHPQNTASRRVVERIGMPLEREFEWKNKPTCVYAVERPAM